MYDPERYETFKSAPARDSAEFVPKLISQMSWKEGERILDYGCGSGNVCTKYLLPVAQLHNSEIDAVDISEKMLAYAKANNGHPLVQYHHGDIMATDFPLKGIEFDRIFSILVLHFIKDYKEALKRFFETLKPGGQLGFTVIAKSIFFDIFENMAKTPKWNSYMKGYERFLPLWYENDEDAEGMIRKALLEAGFVIQELKTEKRSFDYDMDVFVELVIAVNPFLKTIPANLVPELKEDCRTTTKSLIGDSIDPEKSTATATSVHSKYKIVYALASKPTA